MPSAFALVVSFKRPFHHGPGDKLIQNQLKEKKKKGKKGVVNLLNSSGILRRRFARPGEIKLRMAVGK
jgi:hypothetical protein